MMLWWYWLLLGLALFGVEMLTPGGFYFLFFGLGALVVGMLALGGIAGPEWAQWLLFSVLSVASLALFRRRLLERLGDKRDTSQMDNLVGESATPLEDIAPGAVGKAELRGSTWNAKNASAAALGRGQRCRVEKVEGLTLWVRAE